MSYKDWGGYSMKRLLLAVCFVFFIPFLSFADEVDKGLPTDTSSKIKESTRQVIQLGIEPGAVIKMTKSMMADNFSEDQIIAGHEILIKAKKQNLDLAEEDIINKLHEGIAKNVSAERILQVMETYRERHEFAINRTKSMKVDDQQAKVMAKQIVDSLTAGMDESDVNNIIGMLQQKTKNEGRAEVSELSEKTLDTARTMARAGVDSKDIVDVMNNALNRNYNAGDMEKLGDNFMAQARGPSSAPALAKAYSDAIKNGAQPDQLGTFNSGMSSMGEFAGGGIPPLGGSPPPSGGMSAGAAPPSGGGPPPGGGMSAGSVPPADGSNIGSASAPPGAGIGSGTGGAPGGGGSPGGDRK